MKELWIQEVGYKTIIQGIMLISLKSVLFADSLM